MREWFEWMKNALPLKDQSWDPRPAACWDFAKKFIPGAIESSVWNSEFMDRAHTIPWPLSNVWLGVSVENQEAADERIPELLRTPAAVRFLSCEPLIGEVDLDMPRCDDQHHGPDEWGLADDEATPWCNECESERSYGHWLHLDGGIDWVIVGCESGPRARPCSVDWIRSLRDQCAAAGVAYFLKQAVEQRGTDNESGDSHRISMHAGSKRKAGNVIELPALDGEQHAQFPEVSA